MNSQEREPTESPVTIPTKYRRIGYLWRRTRIDAGSLAAMFAGILIAATVLSGAPIYIRSLERVGVERAVDDLVAGNLSLNVVNTRMPFTRAAFDENAAVVAEASSGMDGLITGDGNFLRTPQLLWGPAIDGVQFGIDENGSPYPRAILQRVTHLVENVRFLEGRPPSELANQGGDRPVVEVAVRASRAAEIGVKVNDVLEVGATPDDYGKFLVIVAGLFEPLNADAQVWGGLADDLLSPGPADELNPSPLPLFVRGDAIWSITADSAIAVGTARWFVYLDQTALTAERPGSLIGRVTRFENVIDKKIPRARVGTGPRSGFQALDRRAVFSKTPTYLMGALLISVTVYYLFLVAGLLAARRETDISMLRSRGVNARQIGILYAAEFLPIVLLAIAAAPFLALGIISQLGKIGSYVDITDGAQLPVEVSWVPFAFAIATGAMAIVILITPAILKGRDGIVSQRRASARPSNPPSFQRFFLDLVVLILGGLILWELRTQQSVVISNPDGTHSTDVSALFGPALLLVAIALVFLRIFPALMRLIAWTLGGNAPVWVSLGLWKLARSPYLYAWPILLLVLGSGLAVLAATLTSTLEQSSHDRVRYETAADFRIGQITAVGGDTGPTMRILRLIDGVDQAAIGLRSTANLGTTGRGHEFRFFAVDPIGFGQVSWFREDFSEKPLDALLDEIYIPDRPPPVPVPENSTEIGMWARLDPPEINLFLWVVFQDSSGRSHTVTLGPIGGPEWSYQTATLPDRVVFPATLTSILVFEPASGDAGTPTIFEFDDLVVTRDIGSGLRETRLVSSFESRTDWAVLATSEGLDTSFDLVPEPAGTGSYPGATVGRLVLGRGTDSGIRGISRSVIGDALPVIASESFLAETRVATGEPFVSRVFGIFTPLVVVDTVSYFPTLDPSEGGFVVADYNAVLDFLQARGESLPSSSDEVYFTSGLEDTSEIINEIRDVTTGITRVVDARTLTARALIDPLAVAGWRGMALVALAGTLAIAALGYITYLGSCITNSRQQAAQLSVLGITRASFLRMAAVEHLIVAVMGLALGSVSGLLMTHVAVDAVAHTETGGRLLPPFVLTTNWAQASTLYAVVGIVAVIGAIRVFRDYSTMALHELLRLEE